MQKTKLENKMLKETPYYLNNNQNPSPSSRLQALVIAEKPCEFCGKISYVVKTGVSRVEESKTFCNSNCLKEYMELYPNE